MWFTKQIFNTEHVKSKAWKSHRCDIISPLCHEIPHGVLGKWNLVFLLGNKSYFQYNTSYETGDVYCKLFGKTAWTRRLGAGMVLNPKGRRSNSEREGSFRSQASTYFTNKFLNDNAFRNCIKYSSSGSSSIIEVGKHLVQLLKAVRLNGSSQILLHRRNSHW